MPVGRRGWRVAALGSAVALVLLLFPFRIPPVHPMVHAMGAALHVFLFAGLAWIWGRYLPRGSQGGLLWAVLALVSALVEWAQPYIGRSAEGSDWLYGMAGAACICWTGRLRYRNGFRWAMLLSLSLLPLVWAGGMLSMERRSFPVLANPDAFWARRGWALNGVQLTDGVEKGFHWKAVDVEGQANPAYPGIFRAPACTDWGQIYSLNVNLFWPDPSPAVFAVRVDDQPHNPPYAERFQKEFVVTQGWNSLQTSVDELQRTPSGRLLDLESITQWGVFLVSDIPLDYFCLGAVCLELQEE